jgi:ethanolamine utilization protein EutM
VKAIGLIEMRGLTAALYALDKMCKAASVGMIDMKRVGAGLIAIIVEGDVAAVMSAVEAGKTAHLQTGGELIAANVIPSPHPELSRMLQPEGVSVIV